jgi:hypothetical protein
VAKAFQGDPDVWSRRPWAYVLWCYWHLQAADRMREWVARMQRIEAAELLALAFHEPGKLGREREAAIAAAARPLSDEEARARGLGRLADMERGGVVFS